MPVGSRGNLLSPSRYGLGNGAFRAGKRRLASVGRRRAARFSGSPGGGEVSPSSSSVACGGSQSALAGGVSSRCAPLHADVTRANVPERAAMCAVR